MKPENLCFTIFNINSNHLYYTNRFYSNIITLVHFAFTEGSVYVSSTDINKTEVIYCSWCCLIHQIKAWHIASAVTVFFFIKVEPPLLLNLLQHVLWNYHSSEEEMWHLILQKGFGWLQTGCLASTNQHTTFTHFLSEKSTKYWCVCLGLSKALLF